MIGTLKENLSRYSKIYLSRWWGIWVVNISLIVAIYLALWAIIEPLSVPDKITLGDYFVDRRFAHILLSLFLAAYGSLVITTIARWFSDGSEGQQQSNQLPDDLREDTQTLSIDQLKKLAEINKFHSDLNWQASETLKSTKAEIDSRIKNAMAEKEILEQAISQLRSEVEQGKSLSTDQSTRLSNAIKDRDELEKEVVELKRKIIESESERNVLLAEIEEFKFSSELGEPIKYDDNYDPPAPVLNLKIKSPSQFALFGGNPGEVKATMLLDMGADLSILPEELVKDLEKQVGIKLPYTSIIVADFMGNRSTYKTYHLKVDSFIDSNSVSKSIEIEFLVGRDEHGILGRDFLRNYVVCFDGLNSTFRISHK